MDPNGGGTLIKRELILEKQTILGVDTPCTPIADQLDGPKLVARGDFILHMFKRGDPGVEALWPELPGDDNLNDALYSVSKDAVDHGLWAWPAPIEEWLGGAAARAGAALDRGAAVGVEESGRRDGAV